MIDQTHALIAHFDVERLIDEGDIRWSLIHVDLEVGRRGIAAVQAAKAYHALTKFKIAAPSDLTDVEQPAVESEGTPAAPNSTAQPQEEPCPDITPTTSAAATTNQSGAITSTSTTNATTQTTIAASSATPTSTTNTDGRNTSTSTRMATGNAPTTTRREQLRERQQRMYANARDCGRGAMFATQWNSFGITADSTDDEIKAALDAIEPPFDEVAPVDGLIGIRTHCVTGKESRVAIEYEIREGHDGARWLHLLNGPTGYESCPLDQMLHDLRSDPLLPGWSACAGTPQKWDRLLVTRDSLLRELGEQPERPPQVDNGGPLDDESLGALMATIKSSPQRSVVNGWLAESADAGDTWNPRIRRTVRHFEISRAAHALAEATAGDDEVASTILAFVIPSERHPLIEPDFLVGVTLGVLTIDEARATTEIAERLAALATERGESLADVVPAVLAAA